jgi:hypothetical protein
MNQIAKRFTSSLLLAALVLAVLAGTAGAALAAPSALTPAVNPAAVVKPLSPVEAQGLLFMREEEKLARDVYAVLYRTWGLPIFQNIMQSESQHMAAIKILLDRYGLVDPATPDLPGVFQDSDLQALYDQLVANGTTTQRNALLVGKLIEETDIADLQQHITETTHSDIRTVYANLLKGSENHLKAFIKQLR